MVLISKFTKGDFGEAVAGLPRQTVHKCALLTSDNVVTKSEIEQNCVSFRNYLVTVSNSWKDGEALWSGDFPGSGFDTGGSYLTRESDE